jgi:hypothetical protein
MTDVNPLLDDADMRESRFFQEAIAVELQAYGDCR